MGYTHYWKHKGLSPLDIAVLFKEIKRVAEAASLKVPGLHVTWKKTPHSIIVAPTGDGEYLQFNADKKIGLCKTHRLQPYDDFVVTVLAFCRDHLGWEVRSDGGPEAIVKKL